MQQCTLFLLLTVLLWPACMPPVTNELSDVKTPPGEELRQTYCAAIRGNGNYIVTHFGAMSRILEEFGEVRAMAGGSSASITTFLYESMLRNPLLPASPMERAATLSLWMKSLYGLTLIMGHSEEVQALQGLKAIAQKVRAEGLPALVKVNWFRAAITLKKILEAPEFRNLINPEALKMLANIDRRGYRNYRFKVSELIRAATVIDGFYADDSAMFFREPVINYDGFVDVIGRIGNFYAGVDPTSNALLETFVNQCVLNSPGRTWRQLSALVSADESCGALFEKAFKTYQARIRAHHFLPPKEQDRLQEEVGKHLLAFVPSAILHGSETLKIFERSLASYREGTTPELPVNFDQVKFGYFTPYPEGSRAIENMKSLFPGDKKVQKSINLNENEPVIWRTALRYSTMEPGLSRIVPTSKERAYIGGWSDLHPIQILKAAGCEHTIYLSRIGPESPFVTAHQDLHQVTPSERLGVAEKLNINLQDHWDLYAMENRKNSYLNAIHMASAVWCTDWDSALPHEFDVMFDHSYGLFPSPRGPHQGHLSGLAWQDGQPEIAPMFSSAVRRIDTLLTGCHAP